ncbi:MAG: hypothetical protein ACRD26_15870 [Vicinamibacterales bacterium]
MTDRAAAARNLGLKALRRLASAYKPFVRSARKRARAREQLGFAREARAVEREIASAAGGSGPIVAGPWLAEVGYEALYWVPFLRWFQDAYRIAPERITVVSRGGVREWYGGIAGTYVDIFDHLSPAELAARNEARMKVEEDGGRKQSAAGALDGDILALARTVTGRAAGTVLHPSLMFRLFRHVWHGSLPLDLLWTHTDYELLPRPPRRAFPGLPSEYIAAKFYSGTALPDDEAWRDALRSLVRQATAIAPVVSLDTGVAVDEHEDYLFGGIPGVTSARDWMEPRSNLGVQTALAAHATLFLGTCGGLAWLAPFFGVPTIAVYADDRQLAPHLLVARQAGRRVGAADFTLMDLRACAHLGALQTR